VAMESTGVYWIPLYEILEARGFEVVLAHAQYLSHVPGRKTDMLDCQWIQLLHSCGLLSGSFRPAESICALRALVRERSVLIDQRSDWLKRMQKSLDQMNVRVHLAVSDISGETGMAMIRAIVAGQRDPLELAKLRHARCRQSVEQMAAWLTGNWRVEHLFALAQALKFYDFIQARIAEYEQNIMETLKTLQPAHAEEQSAPAPKASSKARSIRTRGQEPLRQGLFALSGADLTAIDGIGVETAQTLLSEVGTDLSRFPSEKHFVSYAKLCPKLAISGGKPVRGKRRGTTSTRVGAALRMAALTLRHSPTALGAYYRRLARRKGANVAVFAVARKLAILVYRLLRYGQPYVDEGSQAYEQRFEENRLENFKRMAKQLGYNIEKAA
jgi:transposase